MRNITELQLIKKFKQYRTTYTKSEIPPALLS